MIQRDYLIVGAGLAGAHVCEGIREYDKKGTVALVGAESHLPYHRPPLSKKFMKDAKMPVEKLLQFDENWYHHHKIELRLDTSVRAFNAERHLAVLANGETIEFKKACLATGSRPKVPAVAGAALGNVFYLRTVRDALAIKEIASGEKGIVVVGGGFIAAETTASLTEARLKVILLNRDANIWIKRIDRETSEWLTEYYRSKGVKLMMQQDLKGFEGKTVLKNVATKSGDRFAAGMALVAVGAQPNTELVLGTPLHSPNGTPVNEYLETDEKGIYAAGDIALFPDRIFGGARRVDHWDNAVQTGKIAGANITGRKRQKYDYVPYFFSDLFDLSFEFYGDFSRPPSIVEFEGDRAKKKFIARYSELGKLRGIVLCNQDKSKSEEAREAIRDAQKG